MFSTIFAHAGKRTVKLHRNILMHQEHRNNSRLAYCQEAIRTIDISEEDIGWRRYFRAFLIRRVS